MGKKNRKTPRAAPQAPREPEVRTDVSESDRSDSESMASAQEGDTDIESGVAAVSLGENGQGDAGREALDEAGPGETPQGETDADASSSYDSEEQKENGATVSGPASSDETPPTTASLERPETPKTYAAADQVPDDAAADHAAPDDATPDDTGPDDTARQTTQTPQTPPQTHRSPGESLASSIWKSGIQGTNGEPGESLEYVSLDKEAGGTKIFADVENVQARQKEAEKDVDWDFWGEVMSDYEHVAATEPHRLARAIQAGIPAALRGMAWQLMASSKDKALEEEYARLIKHKSSHDKAIQRDLSRTFPKHIYFKDGNGPGQTNLFNVVKAYSLHDEDVGYTQGLQFIVGPLLLNMPDEEAFCLLVRLMKSYDLRSHYVANMPGLQLRLFQFDRLLEELLPGVFIHLLRHGIKSSMYASQWILTLFGYRFPLELVCSVFDMVFAEGVEAIFRFALALMKRTEAQILQLDEFEDLLMFLKNGIFEAYAPDAGEQQPAESTRVGSVAGATDTASGEPLYKSSLFVHEALQVKITPLMLDQYGEEWDNLCRQQTAYTREIERLQASNVSLQDKVRRLEASLAQVNLEHCDLVREVVMAKLDRENLEEELVKYKIAFAEFAHTQAVKEVERV